MDRFAPTGTRRMKIYKFFWTTHKWTGIALALFLLVTATTGFLLLIKKQVAWIQPPTLSGAAGGVGDFIGNNELFEIVFAQNHPDFASLEDIDRVDFRPDKRVHKVRSNHNYAEMQVCAVTGAVLSVDFRTSDLIEQIHDGSIAGEWMHLGVMPLVSAGLLFLVFSGLWLWIEPLVKRRRRRRERAAMTADARRGAGPAG
ncbi:MAG: PepSY domain-containing protein [Phycisphaerales bacterium]